MARALVASKYRGQLDFGEDPARTRFVGVPSPGKASTGKVGALVLSPALCTCSWMPCRLLCFGLYEVECTCVPVDMQTE